MEQIIISLIRNLELIEVRGAHAERLAACLKTLHEVLAAVRQSAQAEQKKE